MWVARVEQQSNCVLVLIAGKFTDTLTHKPNIFISHPPHQTWQFDIHFGWIPGSSVLTTELPNDPAAQLVRAWQIICWVKDSSPSLFPGPSSFISHSSICNKFGQVEGPEHVYNWAYMPPTHHTPTLSVCMTTVGKAWHTSSCVTKKKTSLFLSSPSNMAVWYPLRLDPWQLVTTELPNDSVPQLVRACRL